MKLYLRVQRCSPFPLSKVPLSFLSIHVKHSARAFVFRRRHQLMKQSAYDLPDLVVFFFSLHNTGTCKLTEIDLYLTGSKTELMTEFIS